MTSVDVLSVLPLTDFDYPLASSNSSSFKINRAESNGNSEKWLHKTGGR
jgi:hypothetical protein